MYNWFKDLKITYLLLLIFYLLIIKVQGIKDEIDLIILFINYIYVFFVLPAILYISNTNLSKGEKIIWFIKLMLLNIIGFIMFYNKVYKDDSKKVY